MSKTISAKLTIAFSIVSSNTLVCRVAIPIDLANRVAYFRTCPNWKTFFASTIRKNGVSESIIPIVFFPRCFSVKLRPCAIRSENFIVLSTICSGCSKGNDSASLSTPNANMSTKERRSSRTLIPVGSKAVTTELDRIQPVKRIVPQARLGVGKYLVVLSGTLLFRRHSDLRVFLMPRHVAPYGSWKSPITAEFLASTYVGLDELRIDGDDVYWNELRPADKGRNVIVQRKLDGALNDITPLGFSARTRVHEYGGGCYLVQNGTVYFSNYTDQRLYRQDPGREPRPLTPPIDMRYADGIIDQRGNRIICIREDHTVKSGQPVTTIVSLNTEKEGEGKILVSGNDFYSTPRLSPDGSRLAWLTWNHPNMPWDGTELWVGHAHADGSVGHSEKLAGGLEESIYQPEWSSDGVLYFS